MFLLKKTIGEEMGDKDKDTGQDNFGIECIPARTSDRQNSTEDNALSI